MRLAFAYIRRSSYKQENNNSVEIQKQHILEFAKQNNLCVPEEFIFIEDVTSAFSKRAAQRKQLMLLGEKMIEMNVPIVIFYDVSRMDRTGYSFTIDFFRPMLEKLPDLEVYTTKTNEPLNPEDLNVKMHFLLFQYESEIKSERAIHSLIKDLENEKVVRPGSKTPYGYSQTNKRLEPNEKAEIVSLIFFLSSWGLSLAKIASLLNQAQEPAPKGGLWRTSTVENILKNSIYLGDILWQVPKRNEDQKSFFFPRTHTALIDGYQFQINNLNKKLQEEYGRLDTPFLFLNKIKCQKCEQIIQTQNGSTVRNETRYNYQYYVCKKCSFKVSIDEVHKNLIPRILKHVQDLAVTERTKQQTLELLIQMNDEVNKLTSGTKDNIRNLEEKLAFSKELNDRELELHILSTQELYKNQLNEYQQCQEKLSGLYHTVEADHFFLRFSNVLDSQLGQNEKRLIILYFVDYVLLSPNQQPLIQFKTNYFAELAPLSIG